MGIELALASAIPALIQGGTAMIGGKQAADANSKAGRLKMIAEAVAQQRREAGLADQRAVLTEGQNNAINSYDAATEGQLESIDWGGRQGVDAITAAALDAADQINKGTGKAIDSFNTGEAESTAELRRMQIANAPGMAYLRQIIADPEALTPYQQKQLEDQRRVTGNTIRSSSLAGSGRSAAALMSDVNKNYVLQAQEANRNQAMQASGMMAATDNNAAGRIATNKSDLGARQGAAWDSRGRMLAANAEGAGSRLAGIFGDTGSRRAGVMGSNAAGRASSYMSTAGDISRAIASTTGANAGGDVASGTAQANTATANGKIMGETIGAVGSAIADQFKQSKYGGDASKIAAAVRGS